MDILQIFYSRFVLGDGRMMIEYDVLDVLVAMLMTMWLGIVIKVYQLVTGK